MRVLGSFSSVYSNLRSLLGLMANYFLCARIRCPIQIYILNLRTINCSVLNILLGYNSAANMLVFACLYFFIVCFSQNSCNNIFGLCQIELTAGFPSSHKLGPHWDDAITWSNFKSDTIFGFLSPNYTGKCTCFFRKT